MTDTFELKKVCQQCNVPIPDSYGNLLCEEHYKTTAEETERLHREEEEMKKKEAEKQEKLEEIRALPSINGITEPDYTENPEMPDKDQVGTNIMQFFGKDGVSGSRQLLYAPTRMMYEFIKDYMLAKSQTHMQFSKHIWQPTVVDVGCGGGFGSNIMSQEASFVWGIDKNKLSIDFAENAFTRVKNGIYYSSQVTFDEFDIIKDAEGFTIQVFDIVVAIEIIEHIEDYKTFLTNIVQKFGKRNKNGTWNLNSHNSTNGEWGEYTEWFVSTPNRNHKSIRDDKPKNSFHVREWTSEEFVVVLQQYFEKVTLYKADGIEVPFTTNHSPIIARCSHPKI